MLPKESGQFISQMSKNVNICDEKIIDLADEVFSNLLAGKISPAGYSEHPCHPVANNAAVNWIFFVDTINFCFWSIDGAHWEVEWKNSSYTGYFALCAAVNRAMEEGIDVTNPQVYSKWELEDLEHILRSDNGVQLALMKERLAFLRQVGRILIEDYGGDFINCIKESQQSAQKLVQLVVQEFQCYCDEADYNGERVAFYKRAQILIADIWSCFEGQGLGTFTDIDTITMFADYRVPQVLVYFGVLQYSKELTKKLEKGEILAVGSPEEVEIRGCSIEAIERVKVRVNELIKKSEKSLLCNSILIDQFLWTYRRLHRKELDDVPFHKTLTTFY